MRLEFYNHDYTCSFSLTYKENMTEEEVIDDICFLFDFDYIDFMDASIELVSIEDDKYENVILNVCLGWKKLISFLGNDDAVEGLVSFINLCEQKNEEGIDYLTIFEELGSVNLLEMAVKFTKKEGFVLPDVHRRGDLYKYKDTFLKSEEDKPFRFTCNLIHQQLQGVFTDSGYVYC